MKNSKPIHENSFFKLLCATIIQSSNNPVLDKNELQKKLFNYYDLEEYKILFSNFVKEDDIENEVIDLSGAFLSGYAYGLLTMIHDGNNRKYVINIDSIDSLKELDKYTEEEKLAALNLVNDLYTIKNDNNKAKILLNNNQKKED